MIARTVAAYRDLYAALRGTWDHGCGFALAWLERDVFGRWPHLGDELRGRAHEGGVTDAELAFVWCRSELLGAAGLYGRECTHAGRGGIVGQTWDWHPSLAGTVETRLVRTARGPLLTVAEAGQPAKLGLNASQVWVGLNWLAGSRPVEAGDLPLHVAVRVVLEEATDVADAVALLSDVPLAQAAAFPVHGPGGGCVVERHPDAAAAVVGEGDSWAVHANHPEDPTVRAAQGFDPWGDESRSRATRLAAAVAGRPAVANALAGALVEVAYDADPKDPPAEQIATLAAVVAVPARGSIAVCDQRPTATSTATVHTLDGSTRTVAWSEATP